MSELWQIPPNWKWKNIKEVVKWSSGGTPKATESSYYENGDIPWLITADLNENIVYKADKNITELGYKNSSAKMVDIGSVLIAMYGSIGKLGIAGIECCTNQAIAFSIELKCNNKFLFYYLRTIKPHLLSLGKGGTQQNISLTVLNTLSIPLPPTLEEQQRIVTQLKQLLGKINNANERLDRIPALLKRFRQSVLSAACSGRLTEDWRKNNKCENAKSLTKPKSQHEIYIDFAQYAQHELPATWICTAIANYAACSRGRFSIRPRNDPRCYGGEYPFIQIGDLPRDGGFINKHEQTLNEFGLKTSKMFPCGTVAIAIVGATIANTGILAYDMCFPDSLVGIETGTEVGNRYIEYYLRSVKEDIRQISYAGGGQPNIKLKTLEPFPMPLPPLPEQEEIVRRVNMLFGFADRIEARYNAVRGQLARAERAVYAKAFRGEL
jgi:type I restriction enzyme S subunit